MTDEDIPAATLRKAVAGDTFDIHRLVLANALNPINLDWRRFTVAVDSKSSVVGCGQIRRSGDVDELASLVVADGWQGRGLSAMLMADLLDRGRRPLWLMCESPLVPFYQRYDFRQAQAPAELPVYFRTSFWMLKMSLGSVLAARGTQLEYMVLE